MLDRPQIGERAILVHVNLQKYQKSFHLAGNTAYRIAEFRDLAHAAGVSLVMNEVVVIDLARPAHQFFIGSGKVQMLAELIATQDAELVLFNWDLLPSQERNLERALKCRVLSRTGLILDIFAQRARTFEGQLQVELAQLKHLSTRLIRGWTHLERQKGGIGLRGPGESQLEMDRRLIKNRIERLEARLEKLKSQRSTSRRTRQKASLPLVALVGYTNAGKSTLFNRLSGSSVEVADQLFATLDPTFRQLMIPTLGKVILIDTVGFVSDLPHDLIEAFSATLQEVESADLLVHVIDLGHETWRYQKAQVEAVIESLGLADRPQIEVYNKIDLLPDQSARFEAVDQENIFRVWMSAHTGEGQDLLLQAIQERLGSGILVHVDIDLPLKEAALRAQFYDCKAVLREENRTDEQERVHFKLALPQIRWQQLCKSYPQLVTYLSQPQQQE